MSSISLFWDQVTQRVVLEQRNMTFFYTTREVDSAHKLRYNIKGQLLI